MSVVINTNVASLIAQNNLSTNTAAYQKAMEQISSGLKINSASDDAAGLSISESIKTQVNGNKKALANIQTGGNVLAIAEGGQITVTTHLQRIRELCVQAANETYKASDKTNILQQHSTEFLCWTEFMTLLVTRLLVEQNRYPSKSVLIQMQL